MVKQFWRWLMRLIQPLLPPFLKQKPHRRVKRQRLSDADYQQLFLQLLTGVSQGWNSEEVFQHLGHRMNDRYFKAWLREDGKRLRKLPEADHQLASQLVRLSRLGCGEFGEIAAEIGRDLLMKPAGKGEEVAAVEPKNKVSAEKSPQDSISSIEKFDSDEAQAWFNQGLQQAFAGDFLGAVASFEKAIQIKPNNHKAWLNRGDSVRSFQHYNPKAATVLQLKFPNVSPILPNPNLTQRGYQGELLSYKEGLQHCSQDTHPEGWGLLHQAIGI
ncbi:MAG: hypothetical protein RLP02_19895, partial [Coleofasciculus sp. C2-GNP5-27]